MALSSDDTAEMNELSIALTKEIRNALEKSSIRCFAAKDRARARIGLEEADDGQQLYRIRVTYPPVTAAKPATQAQIRESHYYEKIAAFCASIPERVIHSKDLRARMDATATVAMQGDELVFSGPNLDGVLSLFYAKMNPNDKASTLGRYVNRGGVNHTGRA